MKRTLIIFFLLTNFILQWCFEKEEKTQLLYKKIEKNEDKNFSETKNNTWYVDFWTQNDDPRKTLKIFFELLKQCKNKEASQYMLLWEKYYQNFEKEIEKTWKTVEQVCLEKKDNVKFSVNNFIITWENNEWVIVDVSVEKQNKQIKIKVPMVRLHNKRYIIQEIPKYEENLLKQNNNINFLSWN